SLLMAFVRNLLTSIMVLSRPLILAPCDATLSPLFSSPSRHHRDLHSFPTRRSSDLSATVASLNVVGAANLPCASVLERSEAQGRDRKSTRLNSSHVAISYAVFCLKKKRKRSSNPS